MNRQNYRHSLRRNSSSVLSGQDSTPVEKAEAVGGSNFLESKISLTFALYFYCVFVGALYEIGLWVPLDFNIVEFVEPADLIKSSLYPMIPVVGVLILNLLLAGYNDKNRVRFYNEPHYGKAGKIFSLVIFAAYGSLAVYVIFETVFKFVLASGYEKLGPVLQFASVFLYVYLIEKDYLKTIKNILKVKDGAYVIVAVVCFMPAIAYRTGNDTGVRIKSGVGSWIIVPKENCPGVTSELLYAGRVGGHLFGYSVKDKQICVLPDGAVLFKKKN